MSESSKVVVCRFCNSQFDPDLVFGSCPACNASEKHLETISAEKARALTEERDRRVAERNTDRTGTGNRTEPQSHVPSPSQGSAANMPPWQPRYSPYATPHAYPPMQQPWPIPPGSFPMERYKPMAVLTGLYFLFVGLFVLLEVVMGILVEMITRRYVEIATAADDTIEIEIQSLNTFLPTYERWADTLASAEIFLSITYIVFFLLWLHRAAKNLDNFGVLENATPGWIVGSWFIPCVNFILIPWSLIMVLSASAKAIGSRMNIGAVGVVVLFFATIGLRIQTRLLETKADLLDLQQGEPETYDQLREGMAEWAGLTSDFVGVFAIFIAVSLGWMWYVAIVTKRVSALDNKSQPLAPVSQPIPAPSMRWQ